jgi:hypothetical protein
LTVSGSQRGFDGEFGSGPANAALKLASPQPVPKAGAAHAHLHQAKRAAVAVGQNGRRTVLVNDVPPAAGNLGDSFVPGHALPVAAAFGANAAQRVLESLRVVDVLQIGPHFDAEPALGDRMGGVGIKFDSPAIFHLGDDPAGIRTVVGTSPVDMLDSHCYFPLL